MSSEQGDALTRGQSLGGSQSELFTAQDSEVTLANGYICEQNTYSNGSINGQIENHSEDDIADDQREDLCVNPIYNLYAISVSSFFISVSYVALFGLHAFTLLFSLQKV